MAALNHTIVHSSDPQRSAAFLTRILGLPPAVPFARFLVVQLANDASLDFMADEPPISKQHYAFHVSDAEFNAAFERIRLAGDYWADPGLTQPGTINRWNDGRGVYFKDPKIPCGLLLSKHRQGRHDFPEVTSPVAGISHDPLRETRLASPRPGFLRHTIHPS